MFLTIKSYYNFFNILMMSKLYRYSIFVLIFWYLHLELGRKGGKGTDT